MTRKHEKAVDPHGPEHGHETASPRESRTLPRGGVEKALRTLGQQLLAHPKNDGLRQALRSGGLATEDFFRALLRVVLHLLFRRMAEERGLLTAVGPPVRDGGPFRLEACPILGDCHVPDNALLAAVDALWPTEDGQGARHTGFRDMDVEEIGRAYEGLLSVHPTLDLSKDLPAFDLVGGARRKANGVYYTPPALVRELVEDALGPVIAARLEGARGTEAKVAALLDITVCDPACGSGHFLLAAARRIGREIAILRTGKGEPDTDALRAGTREAIGHCIHGVDLDPLAVDLCRLALWIECHSPGHPLTFADQHIKRGNSLVGVRTKRVPNGWPDAAYKPVTGEASDVARAAKVRHRAERDGGGGDQAASHAADPIPAQIRAADAWTSVFFWEFLQGKPAPPTASDVERIASGETGVLSGAQERMVADLAARHGFFHWQMEFPEVFGRGGFDCVLGNPPFINAIERKGTDRLKRWRCGAPQGVTGTADEAFYFLALAQSIANPQGRIGLVLPRNVLNAPAAENLRRVPTTGWHPRMIRVYRKADLFGGAQVYICLLVLGAEGLCEVRAAPRPSIVLPRGGIRSTNWWLEIQRGDGKRHAAEGEETRRLGDLFEVGVGMTAGDAYDVKPFVVEASEGPGRKLITTGLIDPDECLWGAVVCRYLRTDYRHPRVAESEGLTGSLRRRLARAARPKILIAGLSKRVECFVDARGECIGAVSTYSVYHPRDDVSALRALCAYLLSDPVSDRFLAVLGGNALGGGNTTMKRDFLESLPISDGITEQP